MFILRESEIDKIVNFFYLMFTIYCTIRKILIRIRSNIKSSIRIWIKSFSPHLSRPLSSDSVDYCTEEEIIYFPSSACLNCSPCLVMHIAFAYSKQQNWVRFELSAASRIRQPIMKLHRGGCKIVTFLAQKCHFTRRKYGLQNDILCILEESI